MRLPFPQELENSNVGLCLFLISREASQTLEENVGEDIGRECLAFFLEFYGEASFFSLGHYRSFTGFFTEVVQLVDRAHFHCELHSVEVFHGCVPVDGDWFFALGVLACDCLRFYFAVVAAHQWFVEGKCGMPVVGRFSFKTPLVAVGASEDKSRFSHNKPSY